MPVKKSMIKDIAKAADRFKKTLTKDKEQALAKKRLEIIKQKEGISKLDSILQNNKYSKEQLIKMGINPLSLFTHNKIDYIDKLFTKQELLNFIKKFPKPKEENHIAKYNELKQKLKEHFLKEGLDKIFEKKIGLHNLFESEFKYKEINKLLGSKQILLRVAQEFREPLESYKESPVNTIKTLLNAEMPLQQMLSESYHVYGGGDLTYWSEYYPHISCRAVIKAGYSYKYLLDSGVDRQFISKSVPIKELVKEGIYKVNELVTSFPIDVLIREEGFTLKELMDHGYSLKDIMIIGTFRKGLGPYGTISRRALSSEVYNAEIKPPFEYLYHHKGDIPIKTFKEEFGLKYLVEQTKKQYSDIRLTELEQFGLKSLEEAGVSKKELYNTFNFKKLLKAGIFNEKTFKLSDLEINGINVDEFVNTIGLKALITNELFNKVDAKYILSKLKHEEPKNISFYLPILKAKSINYSAQELYDARIPLNRARVFGLTKGELREAGYDMSKWE